MPVLATADYVSADGDTHFAPHRYQITTYVYNEKTKSYIIGDSLITATKYPGLDDTNVINVLEPEKSKIVASLRQAVAAEVARDIIVK